MTQFVETNLVIGRSLIFMICIGGVTSSRGTGKGTNELIIQLLDYARSADEKIDRHEDKIDMVISRVRVDP